MKSLSQLASELRQLPRVVAERVCAEAAPDLTAKARATFDSGETPYGVPWEEGDEGQQVTLVRTGDLSRLIKYVAKGTTLRMDLGVEYAKYQIGKRPVFPKRNDSLIKDYVASLKEKVARVIREELAK